jgi:FkbM family methyltransferase
MRQVARRLAWPLLRLLPSSLILEIRRRRYLAALRQHTTAEPELAVVAALVKPGDFCVDIGANFGVYTVAMSRMVGPSGQVVSAEPMPITYDLLAKNLKQLGINNAQAIQCAVSDRAGTVSMTLPKWEFGAPNFYEAHVSADEEASDAIIPSRRLDDILAGHGRAPVFIKCDVEGHELSVLKGAGYTLQSKAAWLIEISGNPDDGTSRAAEVMRIMSRAGYGTYRLNAGKLALREPGDAFINYFFLRPNHLQDLGNAGLLDTRKTTVSAQ